MAAPSTTAWPGYTGETHPEIFNVIPPQPDTLKPGQLQPQQVNNYFKQGYVVLDSFFTPEELAPVRASIEELVERLAQKLHEGGKVKQLYKEYGLFQRLTKLEQDFPGANILLHKLGSLTPAFRALWSNCRMLNVVEQLLGTPDIMGSPVWNLRTKTPRSTATVVPWHQDSAYLDNDTYGVHIVTAWIPLLDANEENGTLQVIGGGHEKGLVANHQCCWMDTWYVMLEEEEMKNKLGVDMARDVTTCNIPYGGLVLFHNLTPHRSLPNVSSDIRWSMDLRWQRADAPTGFFGLKDGVRMRSKDQPDLKIDWETFDSVDRHQKAFEACEQEEHDDFDTTIVGPYMKKWEIVTLNAHTLELRRQEARGQGISMPSTVG